MFIPTLLLLSACAQKEPTTQTAPTAQTVDSPETPVTAAPKVAPDSPKTSSPFVGRWTSPSCGSRDFERRITISDDSSITTEDLISPCPPDGKCFWSGIAAGTGTWKPRGDTAAIKYTHIAPKRSYGDSMPTALIWDISKAPAENAAEYCVYTALPEEKAEPK